MRAALSFFFLLAVTLSTAATTLAAIPVPTGQEFYDVPPSEHPIVGDALSGSSPVGVGSVATGGSNLNLQIGLGQFEGPVDIFIALHLPNMNPPALYFVGPDSSLVPFSGDFVVWKSNTVGPVNASLWGTISTSDFPSVRIDAYVIVAPSESAGSQSLITAQRKAPQRFALFRQGTLILRKADAWTLKIDINYGIAAPPWMIHITHKGRIFFHAYPGVDGRYYIEGMGGGMWHREGTYETVYGPCTGRDDGDASALVTGSVFENCTPMCRPWIMFTGLSETIDWKPGVLSCPFLGDTPFEMPVILQPALMPPNVYMPFENGATERVVVDIGAGVQVTYYLTILKGVVE